MKKQLLRITLFVSITAFVAVSGHSDTRVQMSAMFAADFAQRPNLTEVGFIFDDQSELFWGPQWNIITNRVGIGFRGLVNFDRSDTGLEDPAYDWSLDWLGDFFVSYHIFGGRAFIDPFFELGFGNAGRVDLDEDDGSWEQTDDKWTYVDDPTNDEGGVLNMALYPYVAAGVAVNLNPFVIGARFAYRPTVLPIPATQFDLYPLTQFQVSLFGGISLGD